MAPRSSLFTLVLPVGVVLQCTISTGPGGPPYTHPSGMGSDSALQSQIYLHQDLDPAENSAKSS